MFQSRTNQNNEEEIDRWGIVRNWLNDNQADIVLVCGIILVAVISFGLGRLTAPVTTKEAVVIENQEASTLNNMGQNMGQNTGQNNIEQTVNQNSAKQNANSEENKSSANQIGNTLSSEKGIVVASRNGTKYYWPWCSGVSKIKPENLIWFKSEAEAKAAGYAPSSDFTKQAPADYKP